MARFRLSHISVVLVLLGFILAACGNGADSTDSNSGNGDDAEVASSDFPDSPITLIVPYGPGGTSDAVGRQLAAAVEATSEDVQVIVENRDGAAGAVGFAAGTVEAPPDGYTLSLGLSGPAVLQPLLNETPYNDTDDYTPIIRLLDQTAVLSVAPDAEWATLSDFVAEAKDNPGGIKVATGGAFTLLDLTIKHLMAVADIDLTLVPIVEGEGKAVVEMLGGRVDAVITYPAAVQSYVEAGELKPLAVFQEEESSIFPDASVSVEEGYDVTLPVAYFVAGPRELSDEVLTRLAEIFGDAARSPEFEDWAATNGVNLDVQDSSQLIQELESLRQFFVDFLDELDSQ